MRWDRFFDDLEDQLASEWEAERAALDTEAERLRLSRGSLRERLLSFAADRASVTVALVDGARLHATVAGVGADWFSALEGDGGGAALVPLAAITELAASHADLLRSARPAPQGSALAEKMTFGFAMRDLALHDAGSARRAAAITGYRIVPYGTIARVQVDATTPVPLG